MSTRLRLILALVLIAVTLPPFYNAFLLYPSFSGQLCANSEDEAKRLAGHLNTHLLGDLGAGDSSAQILRKKAADPAVREMIALTVRDFSLYKLRLFAASGEILYSSDLKEIGEFNRKDYFRTQVARGRIFSQMVKKNGLSAEGTPIPLDVMEVYVPVLDDGRFVGALEIYYDISDRRSRLLALVGPNTLLLAVVWLLSLALVFLFFKTHSSLLKAKEEMKEVNASLEQRVAEAVEKSRRQEQLFLIQSRHAAMGEMIGAIAHQWRQPLNSLALIVQDIDDAYQHQELDDAYLKDAVAAAVKQIAFMSKTIDDFRNFFRPVAEKASFDLVTALDETLSLLSAGLKNSGILWQVRCFEHSCSADNFEKLKSCHPHLIHGFKNEFEQALINLINNARDAINDRFAREGGVRIKPGRLTFELDREDDLVLITIGDNGGGIDPAVLPKIFDPYFTTKEQGKGTGIGLYMTKVIIEDRIGGRIEAANGDEGAVFTLRLKEERCTD